MKNKKVNKNYRISVIIQSSSLETMQEFEKIRKLSMKSKVHIDIPKKVNKQYLSKSPQTAKTLWRHP